MPSGNALEDADTVQVVTAYAAPPQTVPAVAATPGWYVVGAFFLPLSCQARLQAIMSVSSGSLTARARLFDLSTNAEASGSYAVTSSTTPATRALSGILSLTGNRMYQIQVECTGAAGADKFCAFQESSLTS